MRDITKEKISNLQISRNEKNVKVGLVICVLGISRGYQKRKKLGTAFLAKGKIRGFSREILPFDIRLYLTPLGQARQFIETCGK